MSSPLSRCDKVYVTVQATKALHRQEVLALKDEFGLEVLGPGSAGSDSYLCLWPKAPTQNLSAADDIAAAYKDIEEDKIEENLQIRIGKNPEPHNREWIKHPPQGEDTETGIGHLALAIGSAAVLTDV